MSAMGEIVNASPPVIVFFDLETSSSDADADILQIAMKCGPRTFMGYIKPTKNIDPISTAINGLSNVDGELYRRGVRQHSRPQSDVLKSVLRFLKELGHKCVLVAHNCPFDSRYFLNKIYEENTVPYFNRVIAGFTDTLSMTRRKFPERKMIEKGYKLTTLAAELGIDIDDAHDAFADVIMLETVAYAYFSEEELVANCKSFTSQFYKFGLRALESGGVSLAMINRLAAAEISYDMLNDTYQREGEVGATVLLERRVNGKPTIIKTTKVLKQILDFLEEENSIID